MKILSKLDGSIVFFISTKKINKIIPYLRKNFSGRRILICREMTKYYEEYIRLDVNKLNIFDKQIKGELTIVISENMVNKKNLHILSESDKRIIKKMINRISVKEIIELVNKDNNIPKKDIYNYCLKLKNEI